LEEFETRHQRSVDEHRTLAVKRNQHKADKPTKKNKVDKETQFEEIQQIQMFRMW